MTAQALSVDDLITVRCLELVDFRTPWHRRLWQVGSVLALREVLEYAHGVRSGAIPSNQGLTYVTAATSAQVARDLGLGATATREAIQTILDAGSDKTKGVLSLPVAASLDQMIRRAERSYLQRWAKAIGRDEVAVQDGELVARLVVSHLLDAGFSSDHLHGWLLAKRGESMTLREIIESADQMCASDSAEFEMLVPFTALPKAVSDAPGARYLTTSELVSLCDTRGADRPPGRYGAGALIFTVTAREPWSALAAADVEVRRLVARAVVALPASQRVAASSHALYLGSQTLKWRPLRSRQGEIAVSAVAKNNLLLPLARERTIHALDDAFELLAAVETSTSWASVAPIWAAVEGLLSRPSDATSGVAAADRMAAVLAADYVRAELTLIANRLKELDGPVAEGLRDEGRPFTRRLDHLLEAIGERRPLPAMSDEDHSAVERVRTIFDEPEAVIGRIRGYFKDALRRLFQQRNLLLHGGRFDSVALSATMRTVPPLVGAGLDRLVHAAVGTEPTEPLALAARAENEIALLGSDGARKLHRLLD